MYSWFEGRPLGHRIPNDETFTRIVAAWSELAPLADKVREAPREVIGRGASGIAGKGGVSVGGEVTTFNITASATDEARKWEGWGTALKPAYEPVILVRKPLSGTVAHNVLAHGTGALNIDASRVGDDEGAQGKGRFPANVMVDEYVASQLGERARYFYSPKATKAEREAGLGDRDTQLAGSKDRSGGSFKTGGGNERTAKRANTHPTVKPLALMRYLCRLITPPSGTVLDPFTGSGSTGCAAVLEGFDFVGIEREAEYAEIARARVAHHAPTRPSEAPAQLPLFPDS
jgi:hypothetical protein